MTRANPKPRPSTHAAPRKPLRPPYNRNEQLPRLIGLWPHEVADVSEVATVRIVALLRKALRSERQRGIGGHWTYDINRHLALSVALREERERLRILAGLAAARALPPVHGAKRQHADILHLPFGGKARAATGEAAANPPALRASAATPFR